MRYVCLHIPSFMIQTALIGTYENSDIYLGVIRQFGGYIPALTMNDGYGEGSASLVPEITDPLLLTRLADAVIFTECNGQSFSVLREILKRGKHVLIYPDPNLPFYQLEHLRRIAEEAGVLLYMAHHFYDPATIAVYRKYCPNPEFTNVYRHCKGNTANESEQIRDSLYYEIISVLALNRVPLRKYGMMSVPFNSPDPSLIAVRLEFTNGSTASLTLNQFSGRDARSIEMFSSHTMVRSDLQKGTVVISRGTNPNQTEIPMNRDTLPDINLGEDIRRFFQLITGNSFPADMFASGIMTHKIALEITQKLSTETLKRPH